MVLTVEREYGCQGEKIGRRLAERLNVPFLDQDELEQRAKAEGCYEELQTFLSEEPVNSLLYSIAAENGELLGRQPFAQLAALIPEENFVLLGRCGNAVFESRPDRTAVLICGSDRFREEMIAKCEGGSMRAAARKRKKKDQEQASYYLYYTGKEWADAKDYDLTLNCEKIGIEECVGLILDYVEKSKR